MSYTVFEILYEKNGTTLYRAEHAGDGRSVVLKVCDPARCRPKDSERLRNEYLLGKIVATPHVISPLALTTHQGMPALVLEDFRGQPLDFLIGAPMGISPFLLLAGRITDAVADIHRHGIVHKDLKPQNILVHPATGEVKIIDFGLASRLPRELQVAQPPGLIEGSLPYMSPEQTGRANRAVDSRTDLYSLGVTFYQMLTGQLPFQGRDPVEWVHCHIARVPTSPSELVPKVPEMLGRVVLKLLAKMPEDRYQSARGLRRDLDRCLSEWSANGRIEPFSTGQEDVSDRLQIPQTLYGREAEIALLLQAFGRVVATGIPELVLVSGYSGIGKSALVHELHRPIVRERGAFATGKFDQYKRDIPYATLVQAVRELVLEILAESEERIADWKQRLLGAVGMNGQLVVDVIPQVEFVIGRQPPAPELAPAEAQNRFRTVFRRFVGVFAEKDHPLALFLDDLQWADSASLELLQELVVHPETRHLLVIGAYRDNEVLQAHPLRLVLDEVRNAGARVSDIVLGPIPLPHLAAFVGEALHCRVEEAASLAELIHEKTAGNPFFAIQFLGELYDESLIEFDAHAEAFRWDSGKIRGRCVTDNVVELMVGKLKRLPASTQEALKQLACLGDTAEVALLTSVYSRSEEASHADLWEAVRAGLVIRLDRAYKFLHDRVQEAAYSLIPAGERAAVHLGIGRLLMSRTPPDEIEEKIFEIVNQLNRGTALIVSESERERVAELNLVAGKRAKRSTAYASALKYFAVGSELLTQDSWERQYTLTFALEFHRAECEFLTSAQEASDARLSTLSRHARSLIDIAAVTGVRLDLYTTQDRSDCAVEACLEYLRRVGVDWSPHPTAAEVRAEYDRLWQELGSRPIEDLIDMPAMSDPEWRATMDVLAMLVPPALFTNEKLLCLVAARMANISLVHGNSDASCLGYVWLGMVLGPHFGDYGAGFRFGQLGFELLEKRGLTRFKARVYAGFGYLVNPWSRHLREGIELLRRAFAVAQDTGDLTYASYCSKNLITLLLAKGTPLLDVQREAERALDRVREARFGLIIDIVTTQLRLIGALRDLWPDFSSFNDSEFDEGRFEQHLEADPRLALATCWYWIRKLQARFYAGAYADAVAAATKAAPLLWTSPSFFELAEYHFYGALARAAHYDGASVGERQEDMEALVAHHKQLTVWAANCRENFADRAALVAAELARVAGRDLDAMRYYEEAIRAARENSFIHNEALAYELASRFYKARGFSRFADTYLIDARACYAHWGADGKVKQLDEKNPRLCKPSTISPTATFAVRNEQLDLLTVTKASQTISGEIVLDQLIRTLLELVLAQGGAQRACLMLCQDGILSIAAESAVGDHGATMSILGSVPVDSSQSVPRALVHYVRRTRERVILSDAAAEAGKFSGDDYFVREQPRSILCLPILRQAEVVGLLYLENNLLAGAFTPDRLVALTLLASQAAISIDNARLLERERAARLDAEAAQVRAERLFQERQRAEAEALFVAEASKLLAESLDYRNTLTQVARLAVPFLADWCVIDVLEEGRLYRIAGTHVDPAKEPLLHELAKSHPVKPDSPHPAATAIAMGRTYLLRDITYPIIRAHTSDDAHADIIHALGSRTAMAVPLIAHGRTVGAMSFTSTRPGFQYGPGSIALAEEIARRAAVAIENARLYDEAQESIRARDEFLTVASHELRTPITSLLLCVQGFRRGMVPNTPAKVEQMTALVERQAARLTSLINEMMDVGRIHLGRLDFQLAGMDLVALVRDVVTRLAGVLSQAGCSVELHEQGPVVGQWDYEKLGRVVTNLLANSIKFAPGKPIEISIHKLEGRARLAVTDHGIGIDAQALPLIFEKFKRAVSCSSYGGLGLGLYIARNLVEALGGTVRAESVPGLKTTFTVDLPCEGSRLP